MSPSSASGISPDGGVDPLSEAMDLLDQFNNDGDHVDVDVNVDDLGIVDGFDDFAIDSDDEEKSPSDPGGDGNGSVGASKGRDASGNENTRVPASRALTTFSVVSSEMGIKNNATTTALEPPPAHWANEDDALDMVTAAEEPAQASAGSPLKTRHDTFIHPLQYLGVPPAPAPAPSVGNPYHPAATSNGPSSTSTSTATATSTWAVPSSSAAATTSTSTTWSSLSSNFASFASRAAASVQNAVENAEAAVLHGGAVSGPAPPTAASSSHGRHAGGAGHVPRQQQSVVSYQERQKMLHRKYHQHGASSSHGGGAPTPSPTADSSATNSNIHPSSSSSSSSSSVSPPSTAPPPPTPSSSSYSSATPPTFLEKLTTALDAPTKTKLVSSALGPLLPGERVIMFLNSLNDVKDSRFPHLMVGSDDVLGGNLGRCLRSGSGSEEGRDAAVTVWCCVMTFYRVAVFSYRCSLEGRVLFDDDDDEGGEYGNEVSTATATLGAESNQEFKTDDNHSNAGKSNSYDDNLPCQKESMIRQWVRSQSVSIQFQQAHCSPPPHSHPHPHPHKRYPQHRVFEMPLASIERVEKIMSSAQRQLIGAAPSSSSSSNSIMYGNYPGILPSSSTVSSASSAMSSLGSQMKPLLGGMGMGIAPSGNGAAIGNASHPYTGAATSTLNGGGIGHNGIHATGSGGSHVPSSNHPYAYATASTSTGPLGIVLHGKDGGRWIKFSTNSYTDAMRAHEALQTYAFPGRRNLGYLFAFESRRAEVMAGTGGGHGQSGGGEGRGQGQGQPSASAKGGKGEGGTVVAVATPPTRRRFVPMEEFERQGIFSSRGDENDATSRGHVMSSTSPWAPILGANANYGLCATYPSVLVGPRGIVGGGSGADCGDSYSNETNGLPDNGIGLLRRCAAFRSENRIPALTWGSPHHGGSIWRCSQPKVGLQGNRSIDDERYLYAVAEEAKRANLAADARSAGGVGGGSNGEDRPPTEFLRMLCGRNNESDLIMDGSNSCSLKIMDMRPKSAAMANRTQGYGYENTNYYRGASINFYGIGNIHAVRDAYQKVCALCLSPNTSDIQWMQLVENTNWPSMTRLILSASWQTAFHVHYNRLPVLLHCSHGWDRTSQVASLSQLLLDPYYRTREGFSTLVEKDFLSFGHPFHTRCGHGEGKNEQGGDEGQLSPIFIQFLDCVFQLVNQFPDYFEFNARYLLLLSEHIYSCRFGTLLCDSEREREVVAGIRQRTYCMWEYLDSIPDLINPMFDRAISEKAGVLLMPLPLLLRNVTLWVDRFCMYGAKASIPCMSHGLQYPPQYFLGNHSILHTMGYEAESVLRRALEDAEMWRGTALNALKEVEELRKKVSDKEKESKDDPAADLLSS